MTVLYRVFIFILFFASFQVRAGKRVELTAYIDTFELQPSLVALEKKYAICFQQSNPQNKPIIRYAYAKALIERSYLRRAFSLIYLSKTNQTDETYSRAAYFLVKARLDYKLNKLDFAVAENEKAYRFFIQHGYREEAKLAAINQGFYLDALKKNEAEVWFEKAQLLEKDTKRNRVLLYANWAFHELLCCNNTTKALRLLDKIKSDSIHEHSFLDQYRLHIIHAIIAEKEGRIREEELFLEAAQKIAERNHLNENLRSVYSARSYNAQGMGHFEQAVRYSRKSDSIGQLLPNNRLSEERIKRDLQIRIQELQLRRKLIQQNLQKQKMIGWISWLFAAFTLSGFVWILVLWQKNKFKTQVLLKQNLALTSTVTKKTQQSDKIIDELLISKLEDLVIHKEAYKDTNLNLERLSKKIKTNRTYLSEAINLKYQMNFNAWINEVRIREARDLLGNEKYSHYSIEGIAKEVGYTSISVFNTAFKRVTGITPSRFRYSAINNK